MSSKDRQEWHNKGQRDGAADRDHTFEPNRKFFISDTENSRAYDEGYHHGRHGHDDCYDDD